MPFPPNSPSTIAELDTPAVIIDLDIMEANLARMSAYCSAHSLALRPHTKTHKVPELAHKQIASGAYGITCAKVGEAEIMAAAGITDILIAYPVIGEHKTARLVELAERVKMTVAIDSPEAADGISQALVRAGVAGSVSIGILIEINTGYGRCGVPLGESAISLAQYVRTLPGLEFRGVMAYPGGFITDPANHAALLAQEAANCQTILDDFRAAGIPIAIFSGGSTPSAEMTSKIPGVNEIRPGTYIYNDMNTVGTGACTLADCAATCLVTVVSTAVPGKAMMDGGSKTFSSDTLRSGAAGGYGYIVEDPQAKLARFNEEHGHLDLSASDKPYRVGERLRVIPNHVCTMINLHDRVYGVRGQNVETIWNVAARGKLQ